MLQFQSMNGRLEHVDVFLASEAAELPAWDVGERTSSCSGPHIYLPLKDVQQIFSSVPTSAVVNSVPCCFLTSNHE